MPPEKEFGTTTLTLNINGGPAIKVGEGVSLTCKPAKHGGFHGYDWLHNIPYHVTEDEATPQRIVRNGPAIVVFWRDGTKTVVKCHDEDFDAEKGLGMALARKLWGRCQTERFVRMVEEQA